MKHVAHDGLSWNFQKLPYLIVYVKMIARQTPSPANEEIDFSINQRPQLKPIDPTYVRNQPKYRVKVQGNLLQYFKEP